MAEVDADKPPVAYFTQTTFTNTRYDMSNRFFRVFRRASVMLLVASAPLAAQRSAKPSAKSKAKQPVQVVAPSLIGTWMGTATVPLPDSVITVPVLYTFVQNANMIGGTAFVPGQGSGAVSNVVRAGARIRFRVSAPEGRMLDHDGMFAADGSIEGMVNLNNQPIAKFKIRPKPKTPAD